MTINETSRSGVDVGKCMGIALVLLSLSSLPVRADDVPVLVKDIGVGTASSFPTALTDVNGTLFFRANDYELWRSDGTAGGTVVLKNSEYFDPTGLSSFYGRAYFSAWTSTSGRELWRSDGTLAGTVLVKDVHPGSDCSCTFTVCNCIAHDSNPRQLTGAGGMLFFAAQASSPTFELWRSDGTAAGTVRVPADVSVPAELTNVNGTLFF